MELLFFIVIPWIILAIAVACGASNRNRDGAGWFILSILISPLLAGFCLLLVGTKKVAPVPRAPQLDWRNVHWSDTPEQAAVRVTNNENATLEIRGAKIVACTILGLIAVAIFVAANFL
jgi:hypothetical protein